MAAQLAFKLSPPPNGRRPLIIRSETKTLLATDGLNELFLQFSTCTSPNTSYVVCRGGESVFSSADYDYAMALFNDMRKAD